MLNFKRLVEAEGADQLDRLAGVLEGVARHGSLNKATAALGISYRQAWGLLRRAEGDLGAPLLSRRTGGAAGGGAALTETALDLLARCRLLRGEIEQIFTAPTKDPDRPVLIASTIGPVEVGLLDALEGAYHAATGQWVRHIAAGTGQAMEIARSGRADLLLTHAPEAERDFIAEGWGEQRFGLMTNDFVLCGPVCDPASIASAGGTTPALRRIATAKKTFLSRGDRSGTHLKEMALWANAGVKPEAPWYHCFERGGQGSGATLREAERQGAYLLVDRATLSAVAPTALRVLVEGDLVLCNPFSLISMNPSRFPQLNHTGAHQFITWATGPEGQRIIAASGHFVPGT